MQRFSGDTVADVLHLLSHTSCVHRQLFMLDFLKNCCLQDFLPDGFAATDTYVGWVRLIGRA